MNSFAGFIHTFRYHYKECIFLILITMSSVFSVPFALKSIGDTSLGLSILSILVSLIAPSLYVEYSYKKIGYKMSKLHGLGFFIVSSLLLVGMFGLDYKFLKTEISNLVLAGAFLVFAFWLFITRKDKCRCF